MVFYRGQRQQLCWLVVVVATMTMFGTSILAFAPSPLAYTSSCSSISSSSGSCTSKASLPLPLPLTTTRTSLFSDLDGSSSSLSDVTGMEEEEELLLMEGQSPSDEWEMDCYSRPVVVNGKKLWEVLVTDSNGSFRYRKRLPSNQVNSKTVRKTLEDLFERSEIEVQPTIIRFFRGAMFNMINIALSEIEVTSKPSRCTFALSQWLEDRHRNAYPKMEGYRSSMVGGGGIASFLDVRTPVKLPDALRGEQYAFVSLPLAEFLPGGDITEDNVGVGRLCPVDTTIPGDTFVQGVVILTRRAKALASWLSGTEVVCLSCDLRKRQLVMETDIDTTFLMARLDDFQRTEGAAFEEGKDSLDGLHFISVQKDEDDDPAGFWLLRQIPVDI